MSLQLSHVPPAAAAAACDAVLLRVLLTSDPADAAVSRLLLTAAS